MNEKVRYEIDYKPVVDALDKIANGYKSIANETEKVDDAARSAFGKTEVAVDKANKEIDQQKKLVNKLEKEYKDLEAQLKKATSQKEIQLLNKKIKQTGKELDLVKNKATTSFKKVNKEANSSNKIFESLKGKIGAAFAVGAVIGFVNQIKNLTEETNKAEKSIKRYFNVSAKEREKILKDAIYISKTQEEDIKNVNTAVKNLQNTYKDQGLSAADAFALVDESIDKGSNVRNELFELLKEYPTQLKKVGLSAKESLAFITQSELSGIFSDKGIDAIKEAGERISRFEKPASQSLDALGLHSAQLQKEIESGGKSIFDVMQLAAKKIEKLGSKSVVGQKAIEGIFGTPGVDAGEEYIKMLSTVNLNLDELENKNTNLTDAQNELTKQWIELTVSVSDSDSVISKIYTGILRLATKVLGFFNDVVDKSAPVTDFIKSFYDSIKNVFDGIGKLTGRFNKLGKSTSFASNFIKNMKRHLNLLLLPFKLLFQFIGFVIGAFNDWIDNSPKILGFISKINEYIDKLNGVIKLAPAYLAGFKKAAKQAFLDIWKFAKNDLGKVGDLIVGVLTFDPAKIAVAFAESKSALNDYGSDVAKAFSEGFADGMKKIKAVEKAVKDATNNATGGSGANSGGKSGGVVNRAPNNISTLDPITLPIGGAIKQVDNFNETLMKVAGTSTSLWDSFKKGLKGIGSDDIENLRSIATGITDIFDNIASAEADRANAEVDRVNAIIDLRKNELQDLEKGLDTELKLNEQGFASNVALKQKEIEQKQKELEQAKADEAAALKVKEKAQKAQERIDDARQISSIITAVADLIAQWTALAPPFGHIAGLVQVGVLLAGYASSKIKAKKLRKGRTGILAEGLIKGASHEDGGVPFEVEGGEYHSITPKSQAKEYLPILEAIRTDDKGSIVSHVAKMFPVNYSMKNISLNKDKNENTTDYTERLIAIESVLKQQLNQEFETITGGYRIIKKGNITHRIKLNE